MIITANSTLVSLFTSLANKIRSKLGTSGKYTPAEAISAIDDVYSKGVSDTKKGNAVASDVLYPKTFTSANGVELTGSIQLESTSVTPTTSSQTITPSSGNLLDSVIVGAIQTQTTTTTAGTSAKTVTPSAGKYFSSVTVNPTPSQTKSASPSTSSQTISPDSGKLLSSVSISAISPVRARGGGSATASGINSTGPYVYFPYGWYPADHSTYGSWVYMTAAQAVNACPKQEKTVTGSRSAQTVTPDSGKLLSKVTVNKYPDATGTFTPTGPDLNKAQADMGTTNNLRYVNTATCYAAGVEYCKTLNQHKYSRFSTHQEGGWTLIPLPFAPSGAFQVKITYDTGSYVGGDTIEVRKTDIATTVYGPFPTSSFAGYNWLGGTKPGYLYIFLANRSSNVAISVDILLSNN